MDHSGEGRLWAEIHNLRRAVEAFPKMLSDELARIRDMREDKDNALDARLRKLELESAIANFKLLLIGTVAGLVGTGIVEGVLLMVHR